MKRSKWLVGTLAVIVAVVALASLGEARLKRQDGEVARWVLRMGGEVEHVPEYSINLEGKPVRDNDLRRLKGLHQLRTLNLARTKVTDAGLSHLAGLSNVLYPWDSLKRLHAVRIMSNLWRLDLSGTQVTGEGLRHLELLDLSELCLADCPVTDAGLANLKATNLSTLDLSGTKITDHWQYRGNVSNLDLSNTKLTDAAMAQVSKRVALAELHLEGTGVTDAGLSQLRGLESLKLLTLDAGGVSKAAVARFREARPTCRVLVAGPDRSVAIALLHLGAKVEVLRGLREGTERVSDPSELRAGAALVEGVDLAYMCALDSDLARLTELPELKRLDLSYTGITDAGLAQVGKLTGLTQLHLSHTGVTDAGLVHLRNLTKLEKLDLDETKVSDSSWWQELPGGVQVSMDVMDQVDKVRALCFVALAQAKAGERAASAQTFQRAAPMTNQIADELLRANALRFVALMQAKAGDRASAAKTLRTVLQAVRGFQNAEHRAHMLGSVAWTQAKGGDFVGAYATASGIPAQRLSFAPALAEIAALQSRVDPQAARRRFRQALQAAQALPDGQDKPCLLVQLAGLQARAGYVEGAQQAANAIAEPNIKGTALVAVADAQTRAGARSAGLETLRQAFRVVTDKGSSPGKEQALSEIAQAQAKAGGIAQAVQTAAALPSASQALALALSEIGAAQTKAGDRASAGKTFARALEAARGENSQGPRDFGLARLAEAQSRSRFLREAVSTASAIVEDYRKVIALRDVAIAQAKAGDKAGAAATFRKALAAAKTTKDANNDSMRSEWKPESIEGAMRRWVGRSAATEAAGKNH